MKVTRTRIKLPTRDSVTPPAKTESLPAEQDTNPETRRLRRTTEYMKTFLGTKDLDLLILKAHVLIEYELKRFLGLRLALSDDEFERFEERTKNIAFYQLVNIALAGDEQRDLLKVVSKLNDVRTEIAHRMDRGSYEKRLNELNDAVWGGPDKTPADIHIATTTSLMNIWGQVVRRYLDGRYGEGTFETVMP